MKKIVKTSIAISACLAILLSSVGFSLAEETENDEQHQSMTITLYRHGIDGSVTPVNTEIDLSNGLDYEEVLANKCDDLLKNDVEFQRQLENLTSNFTVAAGFLFITSRGKGFHFESKTRTRLIKNSKIFGKILDKINIFKIKLPKLGLFERKSIVFCRYPNDSAAITTITPIVRSIINGSHVKTVQGNHSVYVYNFVGYTTWWGRFSFSPFDIFPRAFSGYGKITICNNLS
ncbi:MAG TPA: hypothetical protein ENN45_05190 [Bacteroidetes bacterium]|nr:hypothetical protein [Bacteroidota bacterium]